MPDEGTLSLRSESNDTIGSGSDAGGSRGTAFARISPDLVSANPAIERNIAVVQSNFVRGCDKTTSRLNDTFSLSGQNQKFLDCASLRPRVAVNSARVVGRKDTVLNFLGKVVVHVLGNTQLPWFVTKGLTNKQNVITVILDGALGFVTVFVDNNLLDIVKDLGRTVVPAGTRGRLHFFTSRWKSQLEELVLVGFVEGRFMGC